MSRRIIGRPRPHEGCPKCKGRGIITWTNEITGEKLAAECTYEYSAEEQLADELEALADRLEREDSES